MDDAGSEYENGWVSISDGVVEAVGDGPRPEADETVDVGGAVVTPGLVNTHHHLYQTLTRTRAQQADLFAWLRELYPLWGRIDRESEYAAARTGLAALALSGCTTVFDHHYVFPRGQAGLVEAEIQAARELGVRIVASRGSMDLGESQGGLPPDEIVEDRDRILSDTEGLAVLHEEGPGAMVQIAVAPCSPFSVTKALMMESAELARRLGLRLHTHLAETLEEEEYCRGLFGCRPLEYLEQVGWLAGDVWCAHCVHLTDGDVARFGAVGTGVAHCPTSNLRLGAGVAPVRAMLDRGVATSSSMSRRRCSWRAGATAPRLLRPARRCGSGRAAAPRCSAGTTSARSSPASAPMWPCGGRTGSSSRAPTTSRRRSSSPPPSASSASTSAASRSSSTAGS
jgi:cytosine/adenosine deaminase-related metal-dependent hydrolase